MKNSAMVSLNDRPYMIDFTARKVFLSTAFASSAGTFGSPEFDEMMSIRAKLPDFGFETLVEKKKAKKKGILSLETMEAYLLKKYTEDSKEVKEFRIVREHSKVQKAGRFSYMKQWFHEVHPEGYRLLCELVDTDAKAQRRKDEATRKVQEAMQRADNAVVLSNVKAQNNTAEEAENSADHEKSAE